MATIRRFEDLEVWQLARQMSKDIWEISSKGKFAKDWGLRGLINEASGSVIDNIAEGFGR